MPIKNLGDQFPNIFSPRQIFRVLAKTLDSTVLRKGLNSRDRLPVKIVNSQGQEVVLDSKVEAKSKSTSNTMGESIRDSGKTKQKARANSRGMLTNPFTGKVDPKLAKVMSTNNANLTFAQEKVFNELTSNLKNISLGIDNQVDAIADMLRDAPNANFALLNELSNLVELIEPLVDQSIRGDLGIRGSMTLTKSLRRIEQVQEELKNTEDENLKKIVQSIEEEVGRPIERLIEIDETIKDKLKIDPKKFYNEALDKIASLPISDDIANVLVQATGFGAVVESVKALTGIDSTAELLASSAKALYSGTEYLVASAKYLNKFPMIASQWIGTKFTTFWTKMKESFGGVTKWLRRGYDISANILKWQKLETIHIIKDKTTKVFSRFWKWLKDIIMFGGVSGFLGNAFGLGSSGDGFGILEWLGLSKAGNMVKTGLKGIGRYTGVSWLLNKLGLSGATGGAAGWIGANGTIAGVSGAKIGTLAKVGKIAKIGAIVGALASIAELAWDVYKKGPKEGTKTFLFGDRDASTGSRVVGQALTGAGLGAAIGSIVPGLGTAVGAAIGAVIGGGFGLIGPEGAEELARVISQPFKDLWSGIQSLKEPLDNIAKYTGDLFKSFENWVSGWIPDWMKPKGYDPNHPMIKAMRDSSQKNAAQIKEQNQVAAGLFYLNKKSQESDKNKDIKVDVPTVDTSPISETLRRELLTPGTEKKDKKQDVIIIKPGTPKQGVPPLVPDLLEKERKEQEKEDQAKAKVVDTSSLSGLLPDTNEIYSGKTMKERALGISIPDNVYNQLMNKIKDTISPSGSATTLMGLPLAATSDNVIEKTPGMDDSLEIIKNHVDMTYASRVKVTDKSGRDFQGHRIIPGTSPGSDMNSVSDPGTHLAKDPVIIDDLGLFILGSGLV